MPVDKVLPALPPRLQEGVDQDPIDEENDDDAVSCTSIAESIGGSLDKMVPKLEKLLQEAQDAKQNDPMVSYQLSDLKDALDEIDCTGPMPDTLEKKYNNCKQLASHIQEEISLVKNRPGARLDFGYVGILNGNDSGYLLRFKMGGDFPIFARRFIVSPYVSGMFNSGRKDLLAPKWQMDSTGETKIVRGSTEQDMIDGGLALGYVFNRNTAYSTLFWLDGSIGPHEESQQVFETISGRIELLTQEAFGMYVGGGMFCKVVDDNCHATLTFGLAWRPQGK